MSSLYFYYPDGKGDMVFSYEEALRVVEERCGYDLKNYIVENQKEMLGGEIKTAFDSLSKVHNKLYDLCKVLEKYSRKEGKFGVIMGKLHDKLYGLTEDCDEELGKIGDILDDMFLPIEWRM